MLHKLLSVDCNCNVEKETCQATKAIWHYWDSRARWGKEDQIGVRSDEGC